MTIIKNRPVFTTGRFIYLLKKYKMKVIKGEKERKRMKEFYITDDGIRLHAKLDQPANAGEKMPLMILFHGFTGHMEEAHIIRAMETALEAGIAVLRIDLYGHGGSDGAFEDHTLYKWVTNGLAVIDYAKKLDFVTGLYLCGHSQGGLLTVLLAGMCNDTFKAVIPMSPAVMIPDASRCGALLGRSTDPETIPEYLEMGEGKRLKGNYLRVAQTIHVEDEIDRYHGPVCIIHGDADEAVPYSYGVKTAERYTNGQLKTVAGANHCYEGCLDAFAACLKEFLEEVKNA